MRSGKPRFLLYSRPGCGLCEEMLSELGALPEAQPFPIDVLDVDADARSESALWP